MSRYNAKLPNGRSIAWGFDYPLQEFFLHEYFSEAEQDALPEETLNITDGVHFAVSSQNTLTPHPKYPDRMKWSNGEILELMNQYPEIPEEHKLQLALDQPF